MKKMKSALFCHLFIVVLLINTCITTVAFEDSNTQTSILNETLTIYGTEYYNEMPIIENKNQLNYSFTMNEMQMVNDSLKISGEIKNNGQFIEAFSATGNVFLPELEYHKKSGGIVVTFKSDSDIKILSFIIEKDTDSSLLFPVNANFHSKPTVTMVIQDEKDKVIHFSGILPSEFDFASLESHAVIADENQDSANNDFVDVARESKENILMEDGVDESLENETPLSEQEVVELTENYNQFAQINSDDEDYPIPQTNDYNFKLRANTPVVGIPVNVFTTRSHWYSVNNPTRQGMGYYAWTYPFAGTANSYTELIKWEYGYNGPRNTITSDTRDVDGATFLKIINSATYTYNKGQDKISDWSGSSRFRIKNSAIAMGLYSDQQILTRAQTIAKVVKESFSINWKSWTGYLPYGKYISKAITLFDSVSYKLRSVGTANGEYQGTAQGQRSVYGSLVRGQRISSEGDWLIYPQDHLTINFTVTSPKDLPKTAKTQYISNKYYFQVYDKNAYGVYNINRVTVTEYRDSSYRVN